MSGLSTGVGAHILVIDDDHDILRLLSMRLRARGFRVSAVGSAEEGWTLKRMRLLYYFINTLVKRAGHAPGRGHEKRRRA